MYYDLLARFSTLVDALSDQLLRRRVVIPTVVFFVLTLTLPLLGGDLRCINAVGIVALFLLLSLRLATSYVRRTNGPGAGPP